MIGAVDIVRNVAINMLFASSISLSQNHASPPEKILKASPNIIPRKNSFFKYLLKWVSPVLKSLAYIDAV